MLFARSRVGYRQAIQVPPVEKEAKELRLDDLAGHLQVVEATGFELLDHVLFVLDKRIAVGHQRPRRFSLGPSLFSPSFSR